MQKLIAENNLARDAGADDAFVLCQSWKESGFNPNARAGTHRGLLQVWPPAAKAVGVGGKEYKQVISDPAHNIQIGTKYLAQRIKEQGNFTKGAEHFGTGAGYAGNISECADLVRAGRVQDGLNAIRPGAK